MVSRAFKKLSKRLPDLNELSGLIDGLEKHTDREVALLGASVLETCLEFAILSKFPDISNDDKNGLFGRDDDKETGGILSTMSSRVLLAHVLSIISNEMRDDLSKIKHIRNLFAHSPTSVNFENTELCTLCDALVTGARIDEEAGMVSDNLGFSVSRTNDNKPLTLRDERGFIAAYARTPEVKSSKPPKQKYIENVRVIFFFLMCYGVDNFCKAINAQADA
jgi:hypothetical protein